MTANGERRRRRRPGTRLPHHGVWLLPGLRWTDALVAAALLGPLYGVLRLAPALDAPSLRTRAPLIHAIAQALRTAPGHTLREDFFLDLLHRGFTPEEARTQLGIAIDWGRYAELYDYDSDNATLGLEELSG
ncbi:AAA-associated domain-containing protein [Streptomyces sp. enrichment culture]|uniref:AAA-associated domain-containing protein n=1 Tax=Streptomyces sp. enrichment culture TaxID=1795815 RepID=UPI003F573D73